MEQIKKYPELIARAEKKLLLCERQLEMEAERLSFLNAEIEKVIFSESRELKNEQQRKARRLELQGEPDYMGAKRELAQAREARDQQTIEVNRLRNEFSVIKLVLRREIAGIEAVA
ncbi:MAG: hypothetical protein N5P05_003068 [Chroococcopsis gigantea SAG 12.99]|jgi:hypothetical protein|nr:hypothetical protein [Chlorogloea purpurea SAG 13.99]MDV3001462.1 hypothetical protein [Chroococcopsis gigantea SAG 12.99]